MPRSYHVVDAFTGDRYAGNPAAVVLDAAGLTDAEMQAIAAEFNLSETTFVLPPVSPGADARFRWFTPTTEVRLCGHATVGGVHALAESGRIGTEPDADGTAIGIDTLSGRLTAYVERIPGTETGRMIWLDLPDPRLSRWDPPKAELASVLHVAAEALDTPWPAARTQDGDALVFVADCLALNDVAPDFGALKRFQIREGLRGLCVATTGTLTPTIHVQSRFFAPATGVDEDPVTGSVQGPLAAFLVDHGHVPIKDGTAALKCVQTKAGTRAGVVYALVRRRGAGHAVRIGGQAVTTMRGELVA